jgi:hypothetical protein
MKVQRCAFVHVLGALQTAGAISIETKDAKLAWIASAGQARGLANGN